MEKGIMLSRISIITRCLCLPNGKPCRRRPILVFGVLLLLTPVLYAAVKWELWIAKHKVGYLNDACELGESKLDQIRTAIITYAKLLEETNQTYWLDFGTLLGAHRCNDVLPHDGDADISRLANWSMREDKILTAKLAVRLENAIGAKLTIYSIAYKDITVDIFTWKRNNNTLKNFYKVHGNQPTIPEKFVFPLKTTDFSGHKLSVPYNMTSMLGFRYPLSGPSVAVAYKWRCYIKSVVTLGFRPPRCPLPSQNLRTISKMVEKVANISETKAS